MIAFTLILPGMILKIVSFHDFSHQRCLGRLLAALTAQAALIGKSWKAVWPELVF